MGWSNSKLSVNEFYDFSYDELNRLTDAKYSVLLGFGSSSYDTSYSYNKLGGIVSLRRKGYMDFMPLVGATIDDLTLEYTGNRLKRISDAAGSDPLHQGAFSFIDGANKPVEYDYDANGNMTKDLNKQISLIEYNSQNLPSRISINDSCRIGYAYGADGVKHHQEHYTNRNMIVIPDPGTGFEVNSGGSKSPSSTSSVSSSTGNGLPDYPSFDIGDMVPAYAKDYTSTDYCGNVIYESGVLARILTGEGYITLSNDSVIYHYFLTDHLGNNRVVMKQNGVVEQVNEYYPFGGLQGKNSNDGVQPNKFGGKELDRMYGLDLYDFVARPYDPGWGGFITMDPLCEKYPWVSPYAYCMNNPMNYKDPTGMDWYEFSEDGQYQRKIETEGSHRILIHSREKTKTGDEYDSYRFVEFADPTEDSENIDKGLITNLIFVSEKDIQSMLEEQGAFESGKLKFAWESQGGGKFDYSYSILPIKYPKSNFDGINSNSLFLPEGDYMAHNFMNFGNYLWGATGYSVGFGYAELQSGAHLNSIFNSKRNGYPSQWDSKDDQRSIIKGIYHAEVRNYRNFRK